MNEIRTLVEAFEKVNECDNGIRFIYSEKKEELITYGQLHSNALVMLNNLKRHGLKKGDELVFQITNNKDFIVLFWGCICGGIIPVPVNYGYSKENGIKVKKIWSKLQNPYLAYSNDYYAGFMEMLKEIDADINIVREIEEKSFPIEPLREGNICKEIEKISENDIAYIQFSSGSTGTPKGVVLTHKNLVTNIKAIIRGCDIQRNDVSISWLPLTHDMGLIGMHITPLYLGCMQNNMTPTLFVKRPLLLLKKMTEHQVTMTSIPNFGFAHMMNNVQSNKIYDWDLSSLRVIFNGAEMISYELCSKFLDYMENYGLDKLSMFPVYGMAEASVAVTFPELKTGLRATTIDRTAVSIGDHIIDKNIAEHNKSIYVELGFPVENCELIIADDHNMVLENKVVGNIFIRGENITNGYYGEPSKKYVIEDKDGWINTGDIGFLNEHGLVVLGRTKELIIVNGQNYYCSDLERVIENIMNYNNGDAAVVSYFNGDTEIILVFIVSHKKVEQFEEEVEKIRMEFYRQVGISIEKIIPVRHLPKTTSGKIQRFKLVEEYLSGCYQNVLEEIESIWKEKFGKREIELPLSKIEKSISEIITNILSIDMIGCNDDLFQFSIQSLQVMQIYEEINSLYPDKISVGDIYKSHTIREIANIIQADDKSIIEGNPWTGYFELLNNNQTKADYRKFILDICDDNYSKMGEMISLLHSSIENIIFSFVSYLYWDKTQLSNFTGYIMPENDGDIIEIKIDYEKISSIYELIDMVAKNENRKILKMEYIKKNMKCKDLSMIIYNNELSGRFSEQLPFDLIFGIREQRNMNQMELEVTYDANLISGEKVKGLLTSIQQLLIAIDISEWS